MGYCCEYDNTPLLEGEEEAVADGMSSLRQTKRLYKEKQLHRSSPV